MIFFNKNIKFLRTRLGRTQKDIADSLGLKRTTVNALEHSISQPTVVQLQSYSRYFRLSIDSLVNIDMSGLSENQLVDLENGFDVYVKGSGIRVLAIAVTDDNTDTIELVPDKAKAGYASGYADPEYIGALPQIRLPFLPDHKKYRAFPISGDSMLPIPDRSVVVGSFVDDYTTVKSGHAYIVLLRTEGIVFKIAENMIAEKNELCLSSLNQNYEPFTVHVSDVLEVWRFECYISREMPEPVTASDPAMIEMLRNVQLSVDEIKERLC